MEYRTQQTKVAALALNNAKLSGVRHIYSAVSWLFNAMEMTCFNILYRRALMASQRTKLPLMVHHSISSIPLAKGNHYALITVTLLICLTLDNVCLSLL
jgi:hypothetical protein